MRSIILAEPSALLGEPTLPLSEYSQSPIDQDIEEPFARQPIVVYVLVKLLLIY